MMRTMLLTRSSRSFVATITAVLLLLCQTAFAAQACAHTLASSTPENSATAPCHEATGDSTAPAQLPAPTVCEAATALPDAAKVPVLALSDLPSIIVAYEPFASPGGPGARQQSVQAFCQSPPLSVLHCRFLN